MAYYQNLQHPSDLKIRVWGKTQADLFINAALAMAESQFLFNKEEKSKKEETIEIESMDTEILLVEFLSEILSLSDINNLVYIVSKVEQISDKKIKCKLLGLPAKENKAEIKAVTYHAVEVKKTPEGYEAIVLFDI